MILRGHRRAPWVLHVFGFFMILAAPTFFRVWQLKDFDPVRLFVGEESIAALHQGLDALTVPSPISSLQFISTGAPPQDSVLNKLYYLLGVPVGFVHPLPGYASEVSRRVYVCVYVKKRRASLSTTYICLIAFLYFSFLSLLFLVQKAGTRDFIITIVTLTSIFVIC